MYTCTKWLPVEDGCTDARAEGPSPDLDRTLAWTWTRDIFGKTLFLIRFTPWSVRWMTGCEEGNSFVKKKQHFWLRRAL